MANAPRPPHVNGVPNALTINDDTDASIDLEALHDDIPQVMDHIEQKEYAEALVLINEFIKVISDVQAYLQVKVKQ